MYKCDYCGKDETKVKKMIVNQSNAICADCILLSMSCLIDSMEMGFEKIRFNELKLNEGVVK